MLYVVILRTRKVIIIYKKCAEKKRFNQFNFISWTKLK